jgi:hypothetical protein
MTKLVASNVIRFRPFNPGQVRPFPRVTIDYVNLDTIMQDSKNKHFVHSLRK